MFRFLFVVYQTAQTKHAMTWKATGREVTYAGGTWNIVIPRWKAARFERRYL